MKLPGAASRISASATAEGKITVAWDINKDEKVAGYKVYYGLSSRKYKNCLDIGNPAEASPGVIDYILINLEKGENTTLRLLAMIGTTIKALFQAKSVRLQNDMGVSLRGMIGVIIRG